MHRSAKDSRNRYRGRRRPRKKSNIPGIRPGSHVSLQKVFQRIGTPEKEAFTPDPFQIKAVETMTYADCLVTAPTGAGKTWIAERTVARTLEQGGKAWYGTPLKALSNTIYRKFVEVFGEENVGILTGDRKENPDAAVVIGTTEILRNHLYDAMHKGEDLGTDLVILDEAHYLGDEDRGVVWEEIMIYLPPRIPLLMLSATIGNAYQIAGWLTAIRERKCVVVEETKRPVPLFPLFFHPSGTLYPLVDKGEGDGRSRLHKKVAGFDMQKNPPAIAPMGKLPPMAEVLGVLKKYDLLPAIFFLKSRADCDQALELCSGELLAPDPDRKEKLSRRIEELTAHSPHIERHRQRWLLENLAVGSHHSGQLPAWKVVVESLMAEGLLDAMFATSTVAAGVNFPARTVVILNSDRFNGTEFVSLDPTQFQQMAGRAGRRGMDSIGFATVLPGRFMNLKLMAKLVKAPPSDVLSQIRIDFSMVLNLLLSNTPDQIEALIKNSFASFLISRTGKKNPTRKFFGEDLKYLWEDFSLHLEFLTEEGYVGEEGKLTPDGEWASRLRIDTPLLVAQSFRLNLFPENDPALLAGLMASFVNERESEDDHVNRSKVEAGVVNTFFKMRTALTPFARKMLKWGFEVPPLYLLPTVTIHAWASGMEWEKVVRLSTLAEGDLARVILRTADNLRHLKNLKAHFPQTAKDAGSAIDLLMREPVVSFYR